MTTRLDIHSRVHLTRAEATETSKYVRCPEDGRWMPVAGCAKCAKCSSVDATSVTCSPVRVLATKLPHRPEDAPIAEVMDATVLCVEGSSTAKRALQVMEERDTHVALIVDTGGHAVGVCSQRDLVDASPARRVERCMTPFVISLLDGTTVGDAIDVIVDRGLSHVPVLSEGRVIGIVTPRSLIRWLVQNLREPRTARVHDHEDAGNPG